MVILIILGTLLGTIAISGELTGTQWISYIRKFEWDINIDLLRHTTAVLA
ncbi:hypothetical protein KM914_11475 [Virgibacillus pantothenticus]|nr:hypothetical protein [Virgibacillus pantothenticus]MBU8567048.1 hypothetical protein [Virgibacillus pantothenticus]MBU8646809.1 hypothetical protein [Virgibacillus pantothenticus]MBU8660407.1 hypothetical protein [Virgibacillus pantothenticus]MBU8668963.1 hypothetical protein [Virgibacillus pantothenticus]MBU8673165.1 hypothetical protein [Virgibacillus pantothenticus]